MRGSIILLFVVISSLSLCQIWYEPKLIHETQAPITFQKHFVDETDLSVHFLYSIQETRRLNQLYYRKVLKNGTVLSPLTILQDQNHHFASDITGIGDGKRIFILANVKRDPDSEFYDIFFIESTDSGLTWSKPVIIPRKTMNDSINRYYPSILWSEDTLRIWVYFFKAQFEEKEGDICFATRPKGSLIFGLEERAKGVYPISGKFSFRLVEGKGRQFYFGYKNGYGDRAIEFCNNENGMDWDYRCAYCRNIIAPDNIDIAAHRLVPNTIYALTGVKDGERIGMTLFAPRMDGNTACKSSEPCWDCNFMPELISNQICEAEKGVVFLAYATKKRGEEGNNTGLLFVAKDTLTAGKKGINPLASLHPTNVVFPSLSCLYDPFARGKYVSTSAITYNEGKEMYGIYLTRAKLTPDWTNSEQEENKSD